MIVMLKTIEDRLTDLFQLNRYVKLIDHRFAHDRFRRVFIIRSTRTSFIVLQP